MRSILATAVALVIGLAALPAAAQVATPAPAIVGTWNGPFDGDSAGTYSMTITDDASSGLAGTLQVNGSDGGEGYTATFKSVVADGEAATLKYDTPDGAEVQIEVKIDGATLSGSWKVFDAGTTTAVQTGTLTGKKD